MEAAAEASTDTGADVVEKLLAKKLKIHDPMWEE